MLCNNNAHARDRVDGRDAAPVQIIYFVAAAVFQRRDVIVIIYDGGWAADRRHTHGLLLTRDDHTRAAALSLADDKKPIFGQRKPRIDLDSTG